MNRQPFGIGNPGAQAELAAALQAGSGSLLLIGPAGVGKRTIARAFAGAFTCLEYKQNQPCGLCAVCRLRATLPDVNILEPAGHPLGIDAVRALKASLSMRPFVGGRRAVLLDEFEVATEEAQNALLKILEEPPTDVVFLIIASDSGSVLPTVQSRARRIQFQSVSATEISAWLVGQGVPSQEAARIGAVALGRPGLARRLIGRANAGLAFSALRSFGMAERFEKVRLAAKTAAEIDQRDMVADWLLALRSELIALVIEGVSSGQGASRTVKLIRQLSGIARQLRQDSAAPAGLLLESFIAAVP